MTETFLMNPSAIAPLLLAWYGRAGRVLPWRQNRDPYRIWLSEIMLQQTGVDTVIPYYLKFLERFPSVSDLAAAELDAVIALWAGLGYYSRARNLHAAARRVVADYGGSFPAEHSDLQSLSGIGRSTAGAILAIAFDRKGVILDGNVRRVLCRLFALEADPRSSTSEKQLWRWAESLTPDDRPHDYAQAIMDLGATVCKPRRPECSECPLAALCQAKAREQQHELPRSRPKKHIPTQVQVALLLQRDGLLLVRKRPLNGMLGGLWEFPAALVSAGKDPAAAAQNLLAELGWTGELSETGAVRHAYSHFKLDLRCYQVVVDDSLRVAENDENHWLEMAELEGLALHGAHKKILALLAVVG
jgi:A/G-specific adenine glycosylase